MTTEVNLVRHYFKNKFLQSKVARRMVSLFLLSSLIPIILTAWLSMNYVSKLLIENSLQQMHKQGKLFAFSVNDRLLFIEEKIKNITQRLMTDQLTVNQLKGNINKEFTLIAMSDEDGKIEYINGSDAQLPLLPDTENTNGKSLLFSHLAPEMNTALYMAVRFTSPLTNRPSLLVAKIDPIYLWGEIDYFSLDKNICVIEGDEVILFCSSPLKESVWKKISIKSESILSEPLRWTYEDETYLAINWKFYLKSRFETINWNILSRQKESNILKPVKIFNIIFTLIILLTLLIVSLISLSLVRRNLVPLERLIEGTRRISDNDFTAPVIVQSKDEFEELATSFNSMSKRLEMKFHCMTLLSKIDQLTLLDPTDENILFTILYRLKEIIPSGFISITIFEQDNCELGRIYTAGPDTSESRQGETMLFLPEDIALFLAETKNGYLHLIKDINAFPKFLGKSTFESAYFFPLKIKKQLLALICLGCTEKFNLNDDDLNHIRELVNRLAIALTSAAKDKALFHQSNFDSLTQLPNRSLLYDRLDQAIIHAHREDKIMALLFIDLDRFKNVNDSLGHSAGDKLLQMTAHRLKNKVRKSDTVARLGGDEFVVIFSGINELNDIGVFAEDIISIISKPYYIESHEIYINASVGIAVYPFDGLDKKDLLKNSDTAMYRVKSNGRGHYMYFEEKMNHDAVERAELERDLNRALENDEFELYYQPIMDLKNISIIGAESLIRWNHPIRGQVPVLSFITIAEEIGLIESIGEWVVKTACKQFLAWKNQGLELDFIAVNISNRQFLQPDFTDIISNALMSADMSASNLELEITESVLVDERIEDLGIFNKLNAMGVRLSIDDFGTGYSSFSYLKRFPLSTLKIDLSFMIDVPGDENASNIVNSIIVLAHTLNLKVVTEGIESKEQLLFLQSKQSDYGQGYYFNRPLPPHKLVEYIIQNNSIDLDKK